MSLDRLKTCTEQIQARIEKGYDRNLPDDVANAMVEFSSLLGTSSEMVALAEMVYNDRLGELAEQYSTTKMQSTDKKMIFAGRLKTEIYYVTITERLNRALTHSIEAMRSQLSFLKQEMLNAKSGV